LFSAVLLRVKFIEASIKLFLPQCCLSFSADRNFFIGEQAKARLIWSSGCPLK
jgi:hypothetical protein